MDSYGYCGQLTQEQKFTYKHELHVDIVRTAFLSLLTSVAFLLIVLLKNAK